MKIIKLKETVDNITHKQRQNNRDTIKFIIKLYKSQLTEDYERQIRERKRPNN